MSVYVLRIQLEEISPLIWREVEVPDSLSLAALHEVIQQSMGWENYHLYEYLINGERYGVNDPDFDYGDPVNEAGKLKIKDALKNQEDFINYCYDFGDSWQHTVILKSIKPGNINKIKCLSGARSCPPEDVGGVWGYENLCEVMSNPEHEEYEDMCEWAGEDFDPERFDLKQVNKNITSAC